MSATTEVIVIDGGMVNAYLLQRDERFVLVDTLTGNKRRLLEQSLSDAGCSAGNLALIVATHGDTDHIASCAYLRRKFGAPIAMHRAETLAAETGDMGSTRPNMKGLSRAIFSALMLVFRLGKADRFTPDVYVSDGGELSAYGIDAHFLDLPGHSRGSIGVLTDAGDLICGDLMTNTGQPQANTLVDDPEALAASIERVRELGVRTVYPGHGKPFAMSDLA